MLELRLVRLAAFGAALAPLVACSSSPDATDSQNAAAAAAAEPSGPKAVKLALCGGTGLQLVNVDAAGAVRFTTTIPAGQAAGLNLVGSQAGVKASKGDVSKGADIIDDEARRTTVNVKSAAGEWNGSAKAQFVIPGGSDDLPVTVTVTFASQYGGGMQAAGECTPITCTDASAERREPLVADGASRADRIKAIVDSCKAPPDEAQLLFSAMTGGSVDEAAVSAVLAKYSTRVFACAPIGFPNACRGDTCGNIVLGSDTPRAWQNDRCE